MKDRRKPHQKAYKAIPWSRSGIMSVETWTAQRNADRAQAVAGQTPCRYAKALGVNLVTANKRIRDQRSAMAEVQA